MPSCDFVDYECPYCNAVVSFSSTTLHKLQECPKCCCTLIVDPSGAWGCRKLPIPIRTNRLVLRCLIPGDHDDLVELMTCEGAFSYIDWMPLNEEEVGDWLSHRASNRLTQPGGNLCLGIVLSNMPKLIGFVSLYFTDLDLLVAGFTLMLNRRYWSRGYGTETLRALLTTCFRDLGVHRVAVGVDARNLRALRMLEAAGMKCEGCFRKDQFLKGEWIDTSWHAMLNEDLSGSEDRHGQL
jgi:RimJ/RimL family protein N-acetyltransferase